MTNKTTPGITKNVMATYKSEILEKYNKLRREVAKEYGISNMKELVWDDRLAKLAKPSPHQCDGPPSDFCRSFKDGEHENTAKFNKKRIDEFLPFIASGDIIGAELIMKNYKMPFASLDMILPIQTSIDCFPNTCHDNNSEFYDIYAIGEKEMMVYYDVMCLIGPEAEFRITDFVVGESNTTVLNSTTPTSTRKRKKTAKEIEWERKMEENAKPIDTPDHSVSLFPAISSFLFVTARLLLL